MIGAVTLFNDFNGIGLSVNAHEVSDGVQSRLAGGCDGSWNRGDEKREKSCRRNESAEKHNLRRAIRVDPRASCFVVS